MNIKILFCEFNFMYYFVIISITMIRHSLIPKISEIFCKILQQLTFSALFFHKRKLHSNTNMLIQT